MTVVCVFSLTYKVEVYFSSPFFYLCKFYSDGIEDHLSVVSPYAVWDGFLPLFALVVSFSLEYRLRIYSFPFFPCLSSPAITLEIGSVVGSWMWVGC